jgi:hypothetical protein
MIPPLNTLFRLFNGVITIAIASLLLSIFRKTNRRFYLYWGVGYVLYGVNIIIRMLTPTELGVSFLGIIAFLLLMVGFALMVAGIGELVDRTSTFLASSLSILLLPSIQFTLGREWVPLVMIMALAPYLFMEVRHRRKTSNRGMAEPFLRQPWVHHRACGPGVHRLDVNYG